MLPQKNLLIFLIAILVVFVAVAFYFSPSGKRHFAYQRALANLAENEAIVVLDFNGVNDSQQRWFKGEVMEGMTLMHALQAASMAGNFSIQVNSSLLAIDDVVNTNGNKWICFQNGKEISGILGEVQLHPKDRVVCRYK